ncbi:hypothetical protein EDB85DRAFT_1899277 [Lactarius pseudohatsudake]|nr:hypothetical protein EDB85DRAFT_1899277 [Lactarius pseudohatsudake]
MELNAEAERGLMESILQELGGPDSFIPPELLSPPASCNPSPCRLRKDSILLHSQVVCPLCGRGWYVDTGWVVRLGGSSLRRDLERDRHGSVLELPADTMSLAELDGTQGKWRFYTAKGVGWEDGLYGTVSFTYQGRQGGSRAVDWTELSQLTPPPPNISHDHKSKNSEPKLKFGSKIM